MSDKPIDLRINEASKLPLTQRSYYKGYTKGMEAGERIAKGLPLSVRAEVGTASTVNSQRQLDYRKRNNLTMMAVPMDTELLAEFKALVKSEDITLRNAVQEAVMLFLIDREEKRKKA